MSKPQVIVTDPSQPQPLKRTSRSKRKTRAKRSTGNLFASQTIKNMIEKLEYVANKDTYFVGLEINGKQVAVEQKPLLRILKGLRGKVDSIALKAVHDGLEIHYTAGAAKGGFSLNASKYSADHMPLVELEL